MRFQMTMPHILSEQHALGVLEDQRFPKLCKKGGYYSLV